MGFEPDDARWHGRCHLIQKGVLDLVGGVVQFGRLADHEILETGPHQGLTILYGENATGKTGYNPSSGIRPLREALAEDPDVPSANHVLADGDPGAVILTTPNVDVRAEGFEILHAYADNGGFDVASFEGDPGAAVSVKCK